MHPVLFVFWGILVAMKALQIVAHEAHLGTRCWSLSADAFLNPHVFQMWRTSDGISLERFHKPKAMRLRLLSLFAARNLQLELTGWHSRLSCFVELIPPDCK